MNRQPGWSSCGISGLLALFVGLAGSAPAPGADPAALELAQTIVSRARPANSTIWPSTPNASGCLLANKVNNTLDVVDLKENKLLQQLPNQSGIQGHCLCCRPGSCLRRSGHGRFLQYLQWSGLQASQHHQVRRRCRQRSLQSGRHTWSMWPMPECARRGRCQDPRTQGRHQTARSCGSLSTGNRPAAPLPECAVTKQVVVIDTDKNAGRTAKYSLKLASREQCDGT